MYYDLSVQDVRRLAPHIKAIDPKTVVYLSNKNPPIHLAHKFEPGGSYRLDVPVTGYFHVEIEGIDCRINYELESRDANGSGRLQPDLRRLDKTWPKIKDATARAQFASWISDVTDKVRAQVNEQRAYVQAMEDYLLGLQTVSYRIKDPAA